MKHGSSLVKSRFQLRDINDEMVSIKGGTFQRGSTEYDSEQPIRKVTLPDFFLGKYPVTTLQYQAFVRATGTHAPEWMEANSEYNLYSGTNDYYQAHRLALLSENYPVVGVSWHDAVAFCEWLSGELGESYFLPSEAQWEYAARGGHHQQPFTYAGSHRLKEVGWYGSNSHGSLKPVGLKLPNILGLYDMSGNVREWCADHWHDNYKGAPQDGSAWTEGGADNSRVVRGGSWLDFDDFCRVSLRFGFSTYDRHYIIGFRLARY